MGNSASRIAPGVDVRGDGGYAVAWDQHGLRSEGDVWAAWPDWLLIEALRRTNPNTPVPNAADLAPPDAATLLDLLASMPNPAETTRDDYTAVNLAVQGCVRSLEALNLLDDPAPVYDAAAEWSARWDSADATDYAGERARWDDDWSHRDRDISGWRHLLGLAGKLGADVTRFALAAASAEFGALPPEPDNPLTTLTAPMRTAREPSVSEATEVDVARGFAKDNPDVMRYDHSDKGWCLWDRAAGVWRRDETGKAFAAIAEYVRQARALLGGLDKAMATRSFISSVEQLARIDPRLACSSAIWDTDPWLLGVPGGVVDLRTGRLLPADPRRMIAKQTAVAPSEPGTAAPLWLAFLASATNGDTSLMAWIQRFLGYCLTGDISEEMLAFAFGEGGTGKGTLFGAFMNILMDYGIQAPAEMFSAKASDKAEYYRAALAGARLAMASETERGSAWAESALKELTGNEGAVSARKPRGEPFNYKPQYKILITGNHAPNIRGQSSGMERRLRVVPFRHKPPRRDETLKARLVAEYPAILRWVIDGCLAWQRDGLGTCDAVTKASAAYFEEQDSLGAWAAERLEVGEGYREKRADLFNDFARWIRANGEPAPTSRDFYESLRRAFPSVKDTAIRGVWHMRGVGFTSADSAMPSAEASDIVALLH